MKIKFILVYSVIKIILYLSNASANCDFVSARYIDQFESPSSIKSIIITVPKSKNIINLIKILTSKTNNILN